MGSFTEEDDFGDAEVAVFAAGGDGEDADGKLLDLLAVVGLPGGEMVGNRQLDGGIGETLPGEVGGGAALQLPIPVGAG